MEVATEDGSLGAAGDLYRLSPSITGRGQRVQCLCLRTYADAQSGASFKSGQRPPDSGFPGRAYGLRGRRLSNLCLQNQKPDAPGRQTGCGDHQTSAGGWAYSLVCADGPVFRGEEVSFDD